MRHPLEETKLDGLLLRRRELLERASDALSPFGKIGVVLGAIARRHGFVDRKDPVSGRRLADRIRSSAWFRVTAKSHVLKRPRSGSYESFFFQSCQNTSWVISSASSLLLTIRSAIAWT